MGRKLYLECYAGISGDMFTAALIDLGVDAEFLKAQLQTLPLEGYSLNISRVKKMALDACNFDVILAVDNHDHDMQYLYGKTTKPHHHHAHGHSAETDVNTDNNLVPHAHSTHHHEHRHLADIIKIINDSKISSRAKELAVKIFDIIAAAEAKAHGTTKDTVHFHEVGAVDSIIDITAAAICLDYLQIQEVICPRLSEGYGTVRCQHGKIPIPVPAVLNIAAAHKLKLHFTDVTGELITPTGAAIIAAIKTEDTLPECFSVEKIGVGAGKRQYDIPNVLRAMLIK